MTNRFGGMLGIGEWFTSLFCLERVANFATSSTPTDPRLCASGCIDDRFESIYIKWCPVAFVELEPWFFLCLFVDRLVASEIPLFLPKTLVNRCLIDAGGVGPTATGCLVVSVFASMETGESGSASWSRNEFGGDGGVTCRPE